MTSGQFSALLLAIQEEERAVREAGQAEYARDDSNPFANFERVAAYLHISREQVLLVYALKHLDGILSYVDGHKSQREGVRGRIKDLRMYLALLWGMVEEGEQETILLQPPVEQIQPGMLVERYDISPADPQCTCHNPEGHVNIFCAVHGFMESRPEST